MSVSLRPREQRDEAFLLSLYCSSHGEAFNLASLPPAQLEGLMRLQFSAQSQSYSTQFPKAEDQIILIDGKDSGRMLIDRSESEIRLVLIELLPECQNQRAGSSLIRDLQAECASSGRPLRLSVAKTNRAIRLYERLGFGVIGETGSHYQMEWGSDLGADASMETADDRRYIAADVSRES